MVGFTTQELEEMAQADAEIEREFQLDWMEETRITSDLVWVSRLARAHHTTYGIYVSTHSEEELRREVEQRKKEEANTHVSI